MHIFIILLHFFLYLLLLLLLLLFLLLFKIFYYTFVSIIKIFVISGLNEFDHKNLQNNVDIVFHVAATIKFNEDLKYAANLNTIGTQKILDLCLTMKNLKVEKHNLYLISAYFTFLYLFRV